MQENIELVLQKRERIGLCAALPCVYKPVWLRTVLQCATTQPQHTHAPNDSLMGVAFSTLTLLFAEDPVKESNMPPKKLDGLGGAAVGALFLEGLLVPDLGPLVSDPARVLASFCGSGLSDFERPTLPRCFCNSSLNPSIVSSCTIRLFVCSSNVHQESNRRVIYIRGVVCVCVCV